MINPNSGTALSYGAVLFDHPEVAAEGWACESGSSPFRITSTGDLSSGIIWYSNIPVSIFFRKGLRQSPKLRPDTFLRTQFGSLMLELGLREESAETKVSVLAGLFNSVMQFSYLQFGIESPPVAALNNGLRQSCMPSDPRVPDPVLKAAAEATQTYVECEKRHADSDFKLVSLVFHRFRHADHLLSQRYPSGSWSRLSETAFPPSNAEGFRAWQAKQQRPGLFQVQVVSIASSINRLINYGAGAGMEVAKGLDDRRYITYKKRCFMTTEELSFMLDFCDIEIEQIFLCDTYGPAPITLPDWGAMPRHSFAFGIYCENLWTSLGRSLDGKISRFPLAAWIHSYDRLECLKKSVELLHEFDVDIHSYGYGRITLSVHKDNSSLVSKIAQQKRLISPMASADAISHYDVGNGATPEAIMQAAMDRRALNFIIQINERALSDAREARSREQRQGNANRISL